MTDDDILERLLFGGDGDDVVILSPAIDDLAIAPSSAPTEASSNHSDESDAPKRKRQRTSLKHELEYLREKQEALQAQLNELRATTVVRQPSSIWEMRAKTQIAAATRAMQENASLRTLLQEQLKTAQTLERVLKRSPKLELSPQFNREEWRSWRLDADPAARIQSMLAITDHMYDRLEGELIKSKVYDLHDRQSCMNVRTHQNVLWFDFIQSTIMDVDHDAMRSATWALARQQLQMDGGPILSTTGTILADVPEFNMVYTRNESTVVFTSGSSCKSEGRWIARMYTEPHRTVLVYRTILDDALEPHTPGILRDNLAGWVVLQRCETDPAKTKQMVVHQCTPAVSTCSDDGAQAPLPPTGELTEFLLNMLRTHMDSIRRAVVQHKPSTVPPIAATARVQVERN